MCRRWLVPRRNPGAAAGAVRHIVIGQNKSARLIAAAVLAGRFVHGVAVERRIGYGRVAYGGPCPTGSRGVPQSAEPAEPVSRPRVDPDHPVVVCRVAALAPRRPTRLVAIPELVVRIARGSHGVVWIEHK